MNHEIVSDVPIKSASVRGTTRDHRLTKCIRLPLLPRGHHLVHIDY